MKEFKIFERSKLWFAISGIVILGGLVLIMVWGLNLGIDFTGGTVVQIDLGKKFDTAEIRQVTDKYDPEASITYAGENKTHVQIKTKLDLSDQERGKLFDEFREKYRLGEESFVSIQKIGPVIGEELKRKALISLIVAGIGMLVYITFRFEFKFAFAAILAILHDVLVVLTVYALFRIPVNTSFIAAMLTIVGYSINDTIVVFDRVRENIGHVKKKSPSWGGVVNASVSQTMVRSINTSLTTLFTISMIYLLGVEAIKDFALPLIVGIISGTYSSIFIASNVWGIWKSRESIRTRRA